MSEKRLSQVRLFFAYSSTDFGRKGLAFSVFGVTIQPINGRSPNDFCSESIFTTTFHPTVIFGALGNSGDKSVEEQAGSGRKHSKVPETVQKTF